MMKTILYLVAIEDYFISHRLDLAKVAQVRGFNIIVATKFIKHEKFLQSLNFKTINIDFVRNNCNPFIALKTILQIHRVYKKEKPDVIHQIAMQPIGFGSLATIFLPISKVINTVAGLGFVFTNQTLKAKLLRIILKNVFRFFFNKKSTQVIVQNSDDRKVLLAFGIKENNIKLIYGSGIDIDMFIPINHNNNKPNITLVARMVRDKGVYEFINAIKILKNRNYDFNANLVGDVDICNPASLSREELKDWHEQKIINWLGHRTDIKNIWQGTDIAVLPSYREGLPKSLLEALSCGKPIITTDAPGCRELVLQNENGFLVPVKDSNKLAAAIEKLLLDKNLCLKMGAKSRELAVNKFSLDYVITETLNLYKQYAYI